ncbi:MAG: DUF1887 family protein [Nitrospirae bacterium]|nr:DUF1887 family protein [Nitrospirota bacterium]
MSHIHVCLVSDQPIPNLTTVLQLKPDTVVLLVTEEKLAEAKRLEKIISHHGISISSEKISAYDLNNVISTCDGIIKKCASCEVSLNITGGTKIGTLGAFQSFYSAGKPIYYVNTKDAEILLLSPDEKKFKIEAAVSVKDYLLAYGFKVKSYVKDDASIFKRKKISEFLKALAVDNDRIIGEINYSIPPITQKTIYPLTVTFKNMPEITKLCTLLNEAGLAKIDGKNTILIPDATIANYLKGYWFEEYVYMIAKSLSVDEVMLNVEGEWDITGTHTPKNEFDVLISKGNRLYYVSCKTANPDRIIDESEESVTKEYLYELLALGDRAFGLFGKKMLASARPVSNNHVRKRANMMKIALIDGKGLASLKENMKQWLNS